MGISIYKNHAGGNPNNNRRVPSGARGRHNLAFARETGSGTLSDPLIAMRHLPLDTTLTEENLQELEEIARQILKRAKLSCMIIRALPHEESYAPRLPNGARPMVPSDIDPTRLVPLLIRMDLHSTGFIGFSPYELLAHGHFFNYFGVDELDPSKLVLKMVSNPMDPRQRPSAAVDGNQDLESETWWVTDNTFVKTDSVRPRLMLSKRTLPVEMSKVVLGVVSEEEEQGEGEGSD